MKLIIRLSLMLWMSLAPTLAPAASFDCNKASHRVEFLVCGSPQASALDDQLAVSYRRALHRAPDAVALRQQQRWWLTNVLRTCPDEACVIEVYTARIHNLDGTRPALGAERLAVEAPTPPVAAPAVTASAVTASAPAATATAPAVAAPARASAASSSSAPASEPSRLAQGANSLLWTALVVLGVMLLGIALWLATMVAVILIAIVGVIAVVVVLL